MAASTAASTSSVAEAAPITGLIIDMDGMLVRQEDSTPNQGSNAGDTKKGVMLLAGLQRLLSHLKAHHIPFACTSRSCTAEEQSELKALSSTLASDSVPWVTADVAAPAAEALQQASALLSFVPRQCLVVTANPSTSQAAGAAGCPSVAVPPRKEDRAACAPAAPAAPPCAVLSSLLDLDLHVHGLPPFADWVHGVLPLEEPGMFKGTVVKGFGRGSKMLGIPTANLDASALPSLAGLAPGVYAGWASVGASPAVYPQVMSVGWNPYFDNATKTVEPWLLHEFPEDFYGEELRLVADAYLRPEANFTTLENLIARIHEDARVTKHALEQHPALKVHRTLPFLQPPASS